MNIIKLIAIIILLNNMVSAQNPFITHMYSADPSARVFNDTLWVYPSHDQDNANWFWIEDWHVFSATDMINWNDHWWISIDG
jgi:hypothetical protein